MAGQEELSIWVYYTIHACAEYARQRRQLVKKPSQYTGQQRGRGKHFKKFIEVKIGFYYGWNVYRSIENLRKFPMSPADAQ